MSNVTSSPPLPPHDRHQHALDIIDIDDLSDNDIPASSSRPLRIIKPTRKATRAPGGVNGLEAMDHGRLPLSPKRKTRLPSNAAAIARLTGLLVKEKDPYRFDGVASDIAAAASRKQISKTAPELLPARVTLYTMVWSCFWDKEKDTCLARRYKDLYAFRYEDWLVEVLAELSGELSQASFNLYPKTA